MVAAPMTRAIRTVARTGKTVCGASNSTNVKAMRPQNGKALPTMEGASAMTIRSDRGRGWAARSVRHHSARLIG